MIYPISSYRYTYRYIYVSLYIFPLYILYVVYLYRVCFTLVPLAPIGWCGPPWGSRALITPRSSFKAPRTLLAYPTQTHAQNPLFLARSLALFVLVTTCVAELVVSWSNKPYLQGSRPCWRKMCTHSSNDSTIVQAHPS